jgi:long-chain acyl-CoA synthetase
MHVSGADLWPAAVTGELVEEIHFERRLRCYARRPRTVTEMLDRAVERFPDRDAVVDAAERLSWREVRDRARRLATSLQRRHGIKPGDRVALLLVNGWPFCVAVFACAQLGAIAVTLNTKLRSRELEFMLQNSGARVLLTNPEWWGEIEGIRDRLPCEAYYQTPYAELFEAPPSTPEAALDEDHTAFIIYTSGTTGRPKGAMGTHLGIANSVVTYQRCLGLGDAERTLVAVPLFHVTGLIAQLLTMTHVGGTTVVMPTFDAGRALELLDAERITHLVVAPTVLVMLMLQPQHRWAGSSLRVLGYGGAPIAAETVRQVQEWLPACRLHNLYGLTETSSPATVLPPGEAVRRVASVGWPIPTADVRTVDPQTGRACGPDEVGELWARGPMVVPGYWADPAATAAAIGDGWLRTGDLARIDGDGYVTIVDRLKDMINRGGEKVFCVEVEEALCGHPSVLEAAVVGVPDPVYGEAVKACLVLRPGATIEPEEIRAWVRGRLARFKVPRDVVVVSALPRNPGGKVVKGLLR